MFLLQQKHFKTSKAMRIYKQIFNNEMFLSSFFVNLFQFKTEKFKNKFIKINLIKF